MVVGHLANTSEIMVMNKMVYPDVVRICKGYFPETVKGLEEKKFCLVSLDFDLYNPTLEGLRFFFPRMATHGVIMIHDYYSAGYLGVSKAVEEFRKDHNNDLNILPIGDHCSVAIIK